MLAVFVAGSLFMSLEGRCLGMWDDPRMLLFIGVPREHGDKVRDAYWTGSPVPDLRNRGAISVRIFGIESRAVFALVHQRSAQHPRNLL